MNSATPNVSFAAQGWDGSAEMPRATPFATADSHESDSSSGPLDQAEYAAQFSAAMLELIDKLAWAENLQHAGLMLVSELQDYFGCQRVALGLCRHHERSCRLLALAGLAQFDPRSEFVQAVQAALDECVVRNSTIVWPAPSDADRHGTLACQKLASQAGAGKVIAVPLRNAKGATSGAILFLGSEQLDRPAGFQAFLRICERRLGAWVDLVRRAEPGPVARQVQRAKQHVSGWRGKAVLAAAGLTAAILTIPMPYKIKCDSQVQPSARRFIVAPFEGRLEKALIKQGEVVTQGQILARLDGREIRWELAGLEAERSRAAKQRDSAMATQKVAEAQAARLEMDRLDLKIQLLEHRAQNLEVRSPIGGLVISGDLERAEGAPLSIGQTLFEVAPLDQMVVELAVPEEDISHVREGMNATVRLDAYLGRTWSAKVTKIHPRAEVRQSQNAFIAELHLENPDEVLRPGMNGRAKIVGPRRPLAWNLFHKAADWLARKVGC